MKRVLVLGGPGTGKSTFARQLAQITNLPLVHLDRHYWQPGWIEPDKASWASKVDALAAEPCWIMDGNYDRTLAPRLARADLVILLDLPRWLCLWRVLRRAVQQFGRTPSDMASGCQERLDLGFLRYVWNFPHRQRPRILAALSGFNNQIIRCRTPSEVALLLANLSRTGSYERQ